jgi:NADH-quinone oxidoreductase subunit J
MSLVAQVAAGTDTAEIVLFWIFSVLAIGAGLAVITLRNIVHGALMLVLNLLAIAGLFLTLGSAFLAIVQVLVYAGAVMVLFLFVIMLLGIDRDDLLRATHVPTRVLAVGGGLLLAAAITVTFVGPYTGEASICDGETVAATARAVPCVGLDDAYAEGDGAGAAFLGARMFTRFTWPFELAALLLTVATIGAVILARRRDLAPEDEDLEPSRFLPGDEDRELGVDVSAGDPSTDVSRTDEQEG